MASSTTLFRRNFISGVLILVPFAAILWLCVFIINFLGGVKRFLPYPISNPDNFFIRIAVSLSLVIIILLFIVFVGWVSRKFIGRHVLSFLDDMIAKVPMLRSLYGAIKQIINMFSSNKDQFKSVCLIEFPRKGVKTIAFVTNEITLAGQKYFTVFVPTTPNPTSGFTLLVKEEEINRIEMSIEVAFKTIISMGVLPPAA
ncbi:MAG: DUF502 domain-containing protein [bacterium]